MNLPDLYASVVAHRPELAVKELPPCGHVPGREYAWYSCRRNDYVDEAEASALIFQHWFKMLPKGTIFVVGEETYYVDGYIVGIVHDTPIEALAAYYLSTPSTKESK